jgi:FG-GAP-like repeat/FG-GAP repeat
MWVRALAVAALLPALAGSAASTSVPAWGPPLLEGQLTLADETTELRTADLNGDGLRDVIIGPLVYERLDPVPPVFLLNKGGGHFVEATDSVFEGPAPKIEWNREMVVADFNGDGRPDIFIADTGNDNQALNPGYPGQQDRLILSTPDGKYTDATANLPQQRSFTHSGAAADVNGDGHVDIFENNLECCGRDHVPAEILLNDGSAHFTAAPGLLHGFPVNQYGQTYSLASAFADVNGDGHPDLIVGGDEQVERSSVLLNDGRGNFNFFEWLPPKLYAPDALVMDIVPTDVSGDGAVDLLLAETQHQPYYIGSKIQVLINDGDGHFTDETKTRLPAQPQAESWPNRLLVEDFNDDGKPDLAIQYASVGITPEADPTPFWLNENGVFQRIAGAREGAAPNVRGPVGFVNGDGPHALFSVEWKSKDSSGGHYYVSPEIARPAIPTGLVARPVPAGIRISWRSVTGATSYAIWRAMAGTPYGRIGTTTQTIFTDRTAKVGQTYRYAVQARNGTATSVLSRAVITRRR